jgi:hypothetical protein
MSARGYGKFPSTATTRSMGEGASSSSSSGGRAMRNFWAPKGKKSPPTSWSSLPPPRRVRCAEPPRGEGGVDDDTKRPPPGLDPATPATTPSTTTTQSWVPVTVGATTFTSPQELWSFFSLLLNDAPTTVDENLPEDVFHVMLDALAKHPEAAAKMGCGVRAFQVRLSEKGYRQGLYNRPLNV